MQKMKIPDRDMALSVIAVPGMGMELDIFPPQIVQHLAYCPVNATPVESRSTILESVAFIEQFALEQDIFVRDTTGNYGTAVYKNKTDKSLIVPVATHLKGGHQNRANNDSEILDPSEKRTISVNCFEPGRGSGNDIFTDFEDTPPDVARSAMINKDGYDGSWNTISEYTKLIKGVGGRALSVFLEKTEKERAEYALNFETRIGQTGVIAISKALSMIEIFPTPEVFNIYKKRVIRGKIGSLFYKTAMGEQRLQQLILPAETDQILGHIIKIVDNAIKETMEHGSTHGNLKIQRFRKDDKAVDVILTNEAEPQLVYLFGVW